jgi:hypothetical protein
MLVLHATPPRPVLLPGCLHERAWKHERLGFIHLEVILIIADTSKKTPQGRTTALPWMDWDYLGDPPHIRETSLIHTASISCFY